VFDKNIMKNLFYFLVIFLVQNSFALPIDFSDWIIVEGENAQLDVGKITGTAKGDTYSLDIYSSSSLQSDVYFKFSDFYPSLNTAFYTFALHYGNASGNLNDETSPLIYFGGNYDSCYAVAKNGEDVFTSFLGESNFSDDVSLFIRKDELTQSLEFGYILNEEYSKVLMVISPEEQSLLGEMKCRITLGMGGLGYIYPDYEISPVSIGDTTIPEVDVVSAWYVITGTTTAIPEPSTYAMIFGAIALGFVAYRRKNS